LRDLIFVLITVGFFAVTLAYVRACDGIFGRNATGTAADTTTDDPVPAEVAP